MSVFKVCYRSVETGKPQVGLSIISIRYLWFIQTCYFLSDTGTLIIFHDNHSVLDSFSLRSWVSAILITNWIFHTGVCSFKFVHIHHKEILYLWCQSHELSALWLSRLLLLLSSDVHPNPGPHMDSEFSGGFFSLWNWNLNILSIDNFCRVSLHEAHNTLHYYDIIALWETSLNTKTTVPKNTLPSYLYHPLDHPGGRRSGGVGIFYKDYLPLKICTDLSFNECLVCQLNFGQKSYS